MDPADAIPAAARLLAANGAPGNLQQAIFAYNHSASYVTDVLDLAARYAAGGAQAISAAGSAVCQQAALGPLPAGAAGKILAYAEAQLGKPYVYGAAGPDAFDCSGLAMMAYRAAGITIPRTSQAQWAFGTQIPASQVQPGDLVFFAGADGTPAAPGHVGIVLDPAAHTMINAYATAFPVRRDTYGLPDVEGRAVARGRLHPPVGVTAGRAARRAGGRPHGLPGGHRAVPAAGWPGLGSGSGPGPGRAMAPVWRAIATADSPGPHPLDDPGHLGGLRVGAGRGHGGGDRLAHRRALGEDGLGDQPEVPVRALRVRLVGGVARVAGLGVVEGAVGLVHEVGAGCPVLVRPARPAARSPPRPPSWR